MRRTAITTTDTLASKFQSHADVEHARERIHQRSPDSLADFTRDCERVTGEHLHWHAEVVERGDKLFGVRPGRII